MASAGGPCNDCMHEIGALVKGGEQGGDERLKKAPGDWRLEFMNRVKGEMGTSPVVFMGDLKGDENRFSASSPPFNPEISRGG
jgi:hypothetical protein